MISFDVPQKTQIGESPHFDRIIERKSGRSIDMAHLGSTRPIVWTHSPIVDLYLVCIRLSLLITILTRTDQVAIGELLKTRDRRFVSILFGSRIEISVIQFEYFDGSTACSDSNLVI